MKIKSFNLHLNVLSEYRILIENELTFLIRGLVSYIDQDQISMDIAANIHRDHLGDLEENEIFIIILLEKIDSFHGR